MYRTLFSMHSDEILLFMNIDITFFSAENKALFTEMGQFLHATQLVQRDVPISVSDVKIVYNVT